MSPISLPRRRFLHLSTSATVLFGAYAFFVEPFWLEFTKRKLAIAHLPRALVGKKLVHISDIHVSSRVRSSYLIKSLKAVKSLNPDFVVYTGDFITLDHGTHAGIREVFPHLPKGSMGSAAILGNHDYGRGWAEDDWAERVITSLNRLGIPVLRNSIINLSGLQIVGLDDLWSGRFNPDSAFQNLDSRQASIVLSHNPDTLDRDGWNDYKGWILCGHTHGGQCKPPFLPAPIIPVRNKLYTQGHIHLEDGRDCYISRGLGYLHQVRTNVRPEVAVFTLQQA